MAAAEIPVMGGMMGETEVMRRTGKSAIADFLRRNTLYGLMRKSGKVKALGARHVPERLGSKCIDTASASAVVFCAQVIVFDTNIPIQLAFYALLEHGTSLSVAAGMGGGFLLTTVEFFPPLVLALTSYLAPHPPDSLKHRRPRPSFSAPDLSAAPLWDSASRQFVGLMSVTDFIDILRHYHRRGIAMDELSARTIADVMSDADGRRLQHSLFLGTAAEVDLMTAVGLLQGNRHRFLPVVPTGESRVVAVVSYYDVLRYLVDHFREQRRLFEDAVVELGIGTYGDACLRAAASCKLVDALDLLERADVSAIPVVDAAGRVVDIYSRSDITFLAAASDAESVIANLDLTLAQVLAQRQPLEVRDRLHTCSARSSLQAVFELFAEVGFQRLIVTDDMDGRCIGVITARDLIAYFVRP